MRISFKCSWGDWIEWRHHDVGWPLAAEPGGEEVLVAALVLAGQVPGGGAGVAAAAGVVQRTPAPEAADHQRGGGGEAGEDDGDAEHHGHLDVHLQHGVDVAHGAARLAAADGVVRRVVRARALKIFLQKGEVDCKVGKIPTDDRCAALWVLFRIRFTKFLVAKLHTKMGNMIKEKFSKKIIVYSGR